MRQAAQRGVRAGLGTPPEFLLAFGTFKNMAPLVSEFQRSLNGMKNTPQRGVFVNSELRLNRACLARVNILPS